MSVEIQRRLTEVLRKRGENHEREIPVRVIVHPDVLDRLRTRDEEILMNMEQRFSGKLSFRADPSIHKEEFKVVNPDSGQELR